MGSSSPVRSTSKPDALLTVPQVAAWLRISKGRCYELVSAGAFGEVFRLGPRSIRIKPHAVREFLRASTERWAS